MTIMIKGKIKSMTSFSLTPINHGKSKGIIKIVSAAQRDMGLNTQSLVIFKESKMAGAMPFGERTMTQKLGKSKMSPSKMQLKGP